MPDGTLHPEGWRKQKVARIRYSRLWTCFSHQEMKSESALWLFSLSSLSSLSALHPLLVMLPPTCASLYLLLMTVSLSLALESSTTAAVTDEPSVLVTNITAATPDQTPAEA